MVLKTECAGSASPADRSGRINSSGAEGLTPANSPDPFQSAAHRSIFPDRCNEVFAAAGFEAASPSQERSQCPLINSDGTNQQSFQCATGKMHKVDAKMCGLQRLRRAGILHIGHCFPFPAQLSSLARARNVSESQHAHTTRTQCTCSRGVL